jgi:hypothetical protein
MKKASITFLFVLFVVSPLLAKDKLFEADNKLIQYTGRIDFSDPKKPRFWTAGVYIQARFEGTSCEILINDEMLWGNSHNYLAITVDNQPPIKVKLTGKVNTIQSIKGLSKGPHTITICKNTEALIGYLEFVGLRCEKLLPLPEKSVHKIEFIGNSITSGMGSDLSDVLCDKGVWYDQHNAWLAYGPITARALNAQWHLTSESGIGLIRNCCNKPFLMPQVFDKISLSQDSIVWDFKRYQPDVVTICLGQNDGIQDSLKFTSAYVDFIKTLRGYYPNAQLVCLTSPMANDELRTVLKKYITGVVAYVQAQGDQRVDKFFFSRGFNQGCGGHPDLEDHVLMAGELTPWLKNKMGW